MNYLIDKYYASYRLTGILFAGFVLAILSVIFISQPTYAACNNADAPITDSCVSDNCVASGIGNNGRCMTIIQQCANKSVGDINEWGTFGSNTPAACSNAVASCYKNAVDTTACNDDGVLARITTCNDGNVSADGENHCGVDNAIDDRNIEAGGEDFRSNKGIKEQRKNDARAACQKDDYTIQQIQDCQNKVDQDWQDCYGQLGGTATKVSDEQYKKCMLEKATSPQDCGPRGGTWDEATKKCIDPNPPEEEDDPDSPAAAPGLKPSSQVKETCGEARVNLLACEGEGVGALNDVLRIIIVVLTTGIGIAAVGGLAWASILYAKAEDNQSNVSEARELIRNIVIGILLYGFLIAIINWLLPGGVIG